MILSKKKKVNIKKTQKTIHNSLASIEIAIFEIYREIIVLD